MKCYGKTDIGAKRKNNQDCYAIADKGEYLLAAVCDGMGGARGGNIASETAIKSFCSTVKEAFAKNPPADEQAVKDLLTQAVCDANTDVYRKAVEESELEGMGTTLVAVLLCTVGHYAVNVGDSRLYLQKDGELTQLTKDNSFIQYLLDKGLIAPEEAATHPNRNIILRALGVNEEVECDLYSIPEFERLLLCSDGLYNMISMEEMSSLADGSYSGKKRSPGYRARISEMIRRANFYGGTDNITAVLLGTD
jgi:protein phosphatase